MRTSSISSNSVFTNGGRIDASFHLSEGIAVKRAISHSPFPLISVGEAASSIFYGNRAKRVYVSSPEYGIPFLSGSDILQSDLSTVKLSSRKYTPHIEQLRLDRGWILISRSGTVGNTAWSNSRHAQKLASEDVIRIVPNDIIKGGLVYAYLSTRYGHSLLTQGTFGGVIQHIEPDFVAGIPIPIFPDDFQNIVDSIIKESASLREDAQDLQDQAYSELIDGCGLEFYNPSPEEYDYYGPRPYYRSGVSFSVNRHCISGTTINAFNFSERILKLKERIVRTIATKPLIDCIDNKGFYSTGSFPRIEVSEGHGIELINQRDIFDTIIKGKCISLRGVKTDNLVEEHEVIIAGVGTLGESETFCRCVYANKHLAGKLISGEFIRMKSSSDVPSGYLFTWLNSPYGFRLIRNTQSGTKLCRPIPKLLERIPVPILSQDMMLSIHEKALSAQEKLALAASKELEAISLIEHEIERWSK